MGENEWIKKEIEGELLDAFVKSYEFITGRRLSDIDSSDLRLPSTDATRLQHGR